jgi:hypothetical protein
MAFKRARNLDGFILRSSIMDHQSNALNRFPEAHFIQEQPATNRIHFFHLAVILTGIFFVDSLCFSHCRLILPLNHPFHPQKLMGHKRDFHTRHNRISQLIRNAVQKLRGLPSALELSVAVPEQYPQDRLHLSALLPS